MPKYRIIANPVADRGAGGDSIPQVESDLGEHGLDFDVVRTERPWHAAELAQEAAAKGVEAVVAMGGDGTSNEVLNGLMLAERAGQGPCAMGVPCVGRGNDIAHGMNVPTNVDEGCRVLARGYRRTIDVGWVVGGLYPEGRYFGNGVGVGFDAVVGCEAAKMTRLRGFPGYAVAALKTIILC